jgi:3-hydroxyacyl-[acyl-carrier-protein] dehydratase
VSREQVLAAIPHREPFLWVDAIVARSDDAIRTTKRVSPDEPFFAGHYPGSPITPGVLVLEAMFQAGAVLLSSKLEATGPHAGKVPVITKVQDARFKQMVRPGDTLEVEVTLEDALPPLFHLAGRASVGGKLAASVKFSCALAPRPA